MIFTDFGKETIIEQVTSPDKSYTAILINSDQGALGGDTLVSIEYNNTKIIGYGYFEKNLYIGEWREFETIDLKWKDDHTLLINEKVYNLK